MPNESGNTNSAPDHTRCECYKALFEGMVSPGHTEPRVFRDDEAKPREGLNERDLLESIDKMLAALDGITANATKSGWGLSHGVLPRRGNRSGTNEDVDIGRAARAEFDPGDYGGHVHEGRRRLSRFAFPATAVIESGLHGHWFVEEPVETATIETINTRLVAVFGSDKAVENSARARRAPGAVIVHAGDVSESPRTRTRVRNNRFDSAMPRSAESLRSHDHTQDLRPLVRTRFTRARRPGNEAI